MRKNIYYCNHMQSGKIEGEGGGETCRGVWKREEPERQKGSWEIKGLSSTLPFS
jgi:hypothetical protein